MSCAKIKLKSEIPAGTMRTKAVQGPQQLSLVAGAEIGGKPDMPFERYVLLFFAALCVLEGLVFIEVRRLRKFMERK